MNKKDTEKYKKILLERRILVKEELTNIADKDSKPSEEWRSKFPNFEQEGFDIEEASDEVEEYINRLPIEHALESKLKEIDEALERIKKGTYGKCSNCKKDIPKKRLEIIPESNFCLDCLKEKE